MPPSKWRDICMLHHQSLGKSTQCLLDIRHGRSEESVCCLVLKLKIDVNVKWWWLIWFSTLIRQRKQVILRCPTVDVKKKAEANISNIDESITDGLDLQYSEVLQTCTELPHLWGESHLMEQIQHSTLKIEWIKKYKPTAYSPDAQRVSILSQSVGKH